VLSTCLFVCENDRDSFPVPPLGSCNTAKDVYFPTNKGWRKVEDDLCDESMPHSVKKPNGLVPCSIYSNLPHTPVSQPVAPNSDAAPTGAPNGSSTPVAVIVVSILVVVILVVVLVFILIKKNNTVRGFCGLAPIGAPADDGYSRVSTQLQTEEEEEEEADDELGLDKA